MKLCGGYEHFSDSPRHARQMEEFRDVLSFCDLHDIGFCGLPYTWDNSRLVFVGYHTHGTTADSEVLVFEFAWIGLWLTWLGGRISMMQGCNT
jgi:hypothetical protein